MNRTLVILMSSVILFMYGCSIPPGQIKKQTAPGQIKKTTGENPASGKKK